MRDYLHCRYQFDLAHLRLVFGVYDFDIPLYTLYDGDRGRLHVVRDPHPEDWLRYTFSSTNTSCAAAVEGRVRVLSPVAWSGAGMDAPDELPAGGVKHAGPGKVFVRTVRRG